jgi:hypothetical protein
MVSRQNHQSQMKREIHRIPSEMELRRFHMGTSSELQLACSVGFVPDAFGHRGLAQVAT